MMLVVGQAFGFDQVDNLPGGPLWQSVLLEQPWIGAALVGLITIVAAFALNRVGRGKPGVVVAIGGTMVAGGVVVLGARVETDAEAARGTVSELIGAIAEGDAASVEALLAESITFRSTSQRRRVSRDQIVAQVPMADRVIDTYRLRHRGAERDGSTMLIARFALGGEGDFGPFTSVWDAVLSPDGERWVVVELEALVLLGDSDTDWLLSRL